MDPITAGVVSGLIVEAVVGASGPVSRRFLAGKVRLEPRTQTVADEVAGRALVTALGKLRDAAMGQSVLDRVAVFLRSPEGRSLARRSAIAVITGQAKSDMRTAILEEIRACLVVLHGMTEDEANTCAGEMRSIFGQVSNQLVQRFEKEDVDLLARLTADATQELLAGYAQGVGDRNSTLRGYSSRDVADAFSRIGKYRQLLHSRTRELVPGNMSAASTIRLDEGYVSPNFTAERPYRFLKLNEQLNTNGAIPLEQVQRRLHRLVVLGNPGAGKSTLAQYLTWLASNPNGDSLDMVPFIVILREFEQERVSKDLKVTEYISLWVRREMQLEVSARDIELMLMTGRGFVIFDGLDELLVSERRRAMSALIASFSAIYPDASVLVTCRSVGYLESRLPEDVFATLYLDEFNETQVAEYVSSWFRRAARLSSADRKRLPAEFMQQSRSAEDLRRNPLMLGLMCRVFQEWRDIPQNRTELYEDCAGLLFREWDQKRGIKTSKEVLRQDARLALQEIAYWRLTDAKLSKGIPRALLIKKLTEVFLRERFEDQPSSRKESTELVDLWSGRAWVLSDVGNPEGEELYDFTHLTFAEYFAAAHLSRMAGTPTALWATIGPHLRRGEWDVVSALAIKIKDRDHAGCCNRVYELAILGCRPERLDRRTNVLSFLAANLEALLPSPRIRRLLVDECIDVALAAQSLSQSSIPFDWQKEGRLSEMKHLLMPARWRELSSQTSQNESVAIDWDELVIERSRVYEPLATLCKCPLPDVQDEYRRHLSALINGGNAELAARAWLLSIGFDTPFAIEPIVPNSPASFDAVDVLAGLSLARHGFLELATLLERGHLAALLRPGPELPGRVTRAGELRSLADELGWRIADGSFTSSDSRFLIALGRMHELRVQVPIDWLEHPHMARGAERFAQPRQTRGLTPYPWTIEHASNYFPRPERVSGISEIDADWCLGAFRIFAMLEELALRVSSDSFAGFELGFATALAPLIFGRRSDGISLFDDKSLDLFGRWLGSPFREMYRWANGELTYVRFLRLDSALMMER